MSETGDATADAADVGGGSSRPANHAVDGPLGEVESALAAYTDLGRPVGPDDVEAICALGLHRVDLVGAGLPVPVEVVEGWARLGAWDEVERLVRDAPSEMDLVLRLVAATKAPGMPSRFAELSEQVDAAPSQVSLLTAIGEVVASHDPDAGRDILRRAVELAEQDEVTSAPADTLSGLVAALWVPGLDDPEARATAERLRDKIDDPSVQVQILTVTASAERERDPAAARDALAAADKVASGLRDPATRAQAAFAVAAALVHVDEPAAVRLLEGIEDDVERIEDPELRGQVLSGLVAVWAHVPVVAEDPQALASVIRLAEQVESPLLQDRAYRDLVVGLADRATAATTSAPAVLQRAGEILGRVRIRAMAGEASVALVAAWARVDGAPPDPDGVEVAGQIAGAITDPEWQARALAAMATALPDGAAEASDALAQAVTAADVVVDPAARSRTWATLSIAHHGRDDDTARRLLERAEHAVGHVRSPLLAGDVAAQVSLSLALQAMTHPEAAADAEQIAERIPDAASRDRSRAAAVSGHLLVADDPQALTRAQAVADRIRDPESRQEAQADLVAAVAKASDNDGDPEVSRDLAAAERAEQLADAITDPGRRGRALQSIAAHLAGRAAELMLTSGYVPTLPDLAMPPGLAGMPGIEGLPDIPDLSNIPGMPDLSTIPGLADIPGVPSPPAGAPSGAGPEGAAPTSAADDPHGPEALLAKAEELAARIPDPSQRCLALAGQGSSLTMYDPARADRLFDLATAAAEGIKTPHLAVHALTGVAGTVGGFRSPRARALLESAEQRLGDIEGARDRKAAAAAVANGLVSHAGGDLEVMARLRGLLDDIDDVPTRCQVLGQLSTTWTPIDPGRAATLLRRAEYEATQATDPQTRDMTVTLLAAGLLGRLAAADTEAAASVERLLDTAGPATRIRILLLLSTGAGARDPGDADRYLAQAEDEATRITDPRLRGEMLAAVASAHHQRASTVIALPPTGPPGPEPAVIGPVFPDRAWRLLAQAAVDPGFTSAALLTALVRIGGPPAIRAITDHALDVLTTP